MLSAIFFDLGGVLFTDFYYKGDREFFTLLKMPNKKLHTAYAATDDPRYCKNQMSDTKRFTLFTDMLDLPATLVPNCIRAQYRVYQPMPQTIHWIKNIRRNYPHIKMGILSDQPHGVVLFLRKKYNEIFSLFEPKLILFSSELNMTKADTDLKFFRKSVRSADKPAHEILFIDNSLKNVKKAQLLGMRAFFFNVDIKPLKTLLNDLSECFFTACVKKSEKLNV